jgi:putative acetyltransferase
LQFIRDDLTDARVLVLLQEHLDDMHAWSPPESIHALDVTGLQDPSVAFFTAWDDEVLLATGAVKTLSPMHVELKSMRTPKALRGRGAGRAMLEHLLAHARSEGFARVSLETGSQPPFAAARGLYASVGFVECDPFEGYEEDPASTFMTLAL